MSMTDHEEIYLGEGDPLYDLIADHFKNCLVNVRYNRDYWDMQITVVIRIHLWKPDDKNVEGEIIGELGWYDLMAMTGSVHIETQEIFDERLKWEIGALIVNLERKIGKLFTNSEKRISDLEISFDFKELEADKGPV